MSIFINNRISTVLFYMSDVEQGGATVFNKLGLAVFPKKGAALVFHNLHPSGKGNELTMHTACPVLLGDKWVANKWIRANGNEFIAPCHVNMTHGYDVKAPLIRRKKQKQQ